MPTHIGQTYNYIMDKILDYTLRPQEQYLIQDLGKVFECLCNCCKLTAKPLVELMDIRFHAQSLIPCGVPCRLGDNDGLELHTRLCHFSLLSIRLGGAGWVFVEYIDKS